MGMLDEMNPLHSLIENVGMLDMMDTVRSLMIETVGMLDMMDTVRPFLIEKVGMLDMMALCVHF